VGVQPPLVFRERGGLEAHTTPGAIRAVLDIRRGDIDTRGADIDITC
jgi:hypothetical protein